MMKKYARPIALAGVLTLSACGQMPGTIGSAPAPAAVAADDLMSVDYDLVSGYRVASVDATAATVAVTSVSASSTRSDFFKADFAIDGNVHSAWAPATTDTAPALTLSLGHTVTLSRLALKMSHVNATVDVAVRVKGGDWRTVATGLAPVPTTLSELDVATCQADEVKLTFRGSELADLLVCEAQVLGTAATTPTPSPAPSDSPAPMPVPSASPVPTSDDDDGTPCSADGGGWLPVVDVHGKHKVSFGFVARREGGACRGTVLVEDLTMHARFRGLVESLRCHGNVVTLIGHLENGHRFTCTVVDQGRHGRADSFAFASDDGLLFCGALVKDATVGGRIRVHREAVVSDDTDLDALGVQVVRAEDREDIDLSRFNDRCERSEDHDEMAIGRKHGHGHDD